MQYNMELSRRERKKRDKRQRLLTESLRLFREKGFEQTTVAEITQAAGVAKGTFFNYFPTKEDVLLALGEQALGKLQPEELGVWATFSTSREKIKYLFHALARGLERDRSLVKEMVYRGIRLHDLVAHKKSRFDFRATIALLLSHGQRRGEIREDVDVNFVANVLYTLYFQQVAAWTLADFNTSLNEQLDQIVDLILDGIAVRETESVY